MNLRLLSAAVFSGALITGCSTAGFQFVSDPEGAVVRSTGNGSAVGVTPFSFEADGDSMRQYEISPGCYRLPYGYEAAWVSGAKAATEDPLILCTTPGNKNPVFTIRFDRPKDAPGLEADLRAALANAQNRAAQEAARAEALREEMMFYDGFWGPGWGFGWGGMMYAPAHRRGGHRPPPPPHRPRR